MVCFVAFLGSRELWSVPFEVLGQAGDDEIQVFCQLGQMEMESSSASPSSSTWFRYASVRAVLSSTMPHASGVILSLLEGP